MTPSSSASDGSTLEGRALEWGRLRLTLGASSVGESASALDGLAGGGATSGGGMGAAQASTSRGRGDGWLGTTEAILAR